MTEKALVTVMWATIIYMAVSIWRFIKTFDHVLPKLSDKERERYRIRLERFDKQADEAFYEENTTTPEDMRNSVIGLMVEAWRLIRVFERVLTKLEPGEVRQHSGQLQWFIKNMKGALNYAGMKTVSIENQSYDLGMAATPLNIGAFDAEDTLVVDQMLEPIIMGQEGLVKTGVITLKEAGS